ncbi:MAG TPA: HAMP domain-containing histidine kinase [Candidatus Limivivens merdigallinarum]|uniref:histidine kinase n=1 Tax=Candidatus Limivivens merdigallinarum TaxID=2840859 RepID=A0A9D0ZV59_9FIRM|nr:HAMP domain-containing histidine kinase [Candidatus Limivivens merdigallinarum]
MNRLKKYGKSLQFRIFIIFILVGVIPIMLIKQSILKSYEKQSITQRGTMVQNQCVNIAEQLYSTGYINGTDSEVVEMELFQLGNLYNGRIVIVDSGFQIIRDTYDIDEGRIIVSEEILKCFEGTNTMRYDKDNEFIEMTIPVEDEDGGITGVMVVSMPTTDIQDSREDLDRKVVILQIGMFIIILGGAFYASKILVKPFGKVTQSLDELTGGFLEEDISIPDYTETQLLSEAYNRMLKRMRVLEESRQEFVSNVSHELKTPITSIKVLADSLIAQEDVPVELYKEFMTDIGEEIDRENKIINDLLSLVKLDKKSADIHIEEKNINELLELLVKRIRPIAEKKEVELVLESFKPVIAQVDETKISLAFSNLIENAVKYNKEGGWVHVSLNVDHKYFYVKVEDSGIGIPEDAQEHIFERFYRVDKSHSREIGGTGLGLAITRNAVLLHRGAIKVYSKEGEGTTFTVRIPLVYTE